MAECQPRARIPAYDSSACLCSHAGFPCPDKVGPYIMGSVAGVGGFGLTRERGILKQGTIMRLRLFQSG
jgi:hypothetical protein